MPSNRDGEIMRAETKRLKIPAHRTIGLRKPVPPKPSPDLRVFRAMSKISRRVTAQEIDELIGPA